MNNTPLALLLQKHGMKLSDLVQAGIPYGTLIAHYYGARNMSIISARRYASALKMPLGEFISCCCESKTEIAPVGDQQT